MRTIAQLGVIILLVAALAPFVYMAGRSLGRQFKKTIWKEQNEEREQTPESDD